LALSCFAGELLYAVVGILYKKLFEHPKTRPFFVGKNASKIKRHMVSGTLVKRSSFAYFLAHPEDTA